MKARSFSIKVFDNQNYSQWGRMTESVIFKLIWSLYVLIRRNGRIHADPFFIRNFAFPKIE